MIGETDKKFLKTEGKYVLHGYPRYKFDKNKDNWLLIALKDNPGIIDEYKKHTQTFKAMWFGEFTGKLLMSIAYAYEMSGDDGLHNAGEELTASLSQVQDPEGYLGPFKDKNRILGEGEETAWDLWGHYHNIMALYKWYELTGNNVAKQTAIRAIDYVYDFMQADGRHYVDADWTEMNLAITHAFAFLYNKTGDKRYLNEALRILNYDWRQPDKGGKGFWNKQPGDWYCQALENKEFYRSSKPRWEALHAIMALAELYKATGEQSYYDAFEQIWWSIRRTDIHNNGSFSSGEGACNAAYINDGAIETCCSIAWAELSVEYLKLCKKSMIADELELTCMNALYAAQMELSGESKQYYVYHTPMDGQKTSAYRSIGGVTQQGEVDAEDASCCQFNGPKGPSMIGQWGCMTDGRDVYLNYYGQSEITVTLPDNVLHIRQTTDYPVSGKINLKIDCERTPELDFFLRIPCWAGKTTLKIGGETHYPASGEYFPLRLKEKENEISIDFDMRVHFLKGESYGGFASLYYGPVLLARECKTAYSPAFAAKDFDMERIAVSPRANGILSLTVSKGKRQTGFIDFASAGSGKDKNGFGKNYVSWFPVSGLSGQGFKMFDKPKWCEFPKNGE